MIEAQKAEDKRLAAEALARDAQLLQQQQQKEYEARLAREQHAAEVRLQIEKKQTAAEAVSCECSCETVCCSK